jgi:hypothetical protein
MSVFIFHNKFHRSNHHTIAMSGFPDSASDPIASIEYPYLGIFHNNVYDKDGDFLALDNSYNWKSSYETVTANALEWNKFRTTYTTVNTFSGFWMNNASLFTSVSPFSSNWESFQKTFNLQYNNWNVNVSNAVISNKVQEFTTQKTFSAATIYPNNIGNIMWDLSSNQVAIYLTTNTSSFSGFYGAQKGGLYDLLLITDSTCNSALSVHFNPEYFKFSQNTNSFSITGIHARKFKFIYDGEFLYGKDYLYDINAPERNLYYAGNGILLFENNISINPISLNFDESFTQDPTNTSLSILGPDPYDSSNSVIITKSEYNEDFVFTFVTLSALSASLPYYRPDSDDRINVVLPNSNVIPATNSLSASKSIFLTRCDPYQSIQIFTRSYGYISELIVNDVEIKDFYFRPDGYSKNETGHIITANPSYMDARVQSIFVEFGQPVPVLPTLSSGLSLWLDALDYSTVNFTYIDGNNCITSLSSKISGSNIYFTSNTTTSSYYNTLPKQSFNYNLSSTHYSNLLLSGNIDFCSFTVFTPYNSSANMEWLWANANYGIFKIPNKYSVGIGTPLKYYEYEYGYNNVTKPLCVSTRYLSGNTIRPPSQSVIINDSNGYVNVISLTANFSNDFTMIGGRDPLSGFSKYKLHELLLYKGFKNSTEVEIINDYLLDKWKFL